MRTIGVEDVAGLVTGLRGKGCSEKTAAEALATLHSIVRFAMRNGWIADNPVGKLEADERPHPTPGGASGCLGARRSGAWRTLACRDTGRCSPPRSTRGCGSPSCWDRSGMTSTSPPA